MYVCMYARKNTSSGDKNRTNDFRTSRRIGYLLDPSGDESNIIPQNIVIMKAEVRCSILHYSGKYIL